MRISLLLMLIVAATACPNPAAPANSSAAQAPWQDAGTVTATPAPPTPSPENAAPVQTGGPKTAREFLALLPEKYFYLEGCDRKSDRNCDKARAEYLKNFLEVDDPANGYLRASCDGAQACLTMALFKRPDGTYLVAVNTEMETSNEYHFLDYSGGKWTDVSSQAVPGFSTKNYYELPRYGTTVKVFAKKMIEQDGDLEISEKGKFLYDLEWKSGRFSKK